MFHRDCQRHRHRHLHEPWFSIERHSVRVRFADALGRGRNRRSLWRALLWRTECRVTAVRRRVSFSVADLSPSARIHGGICFRDRRICGADRAGRTGLWQIPAGRARLWFTCSPFIRGGLGGGAISSQEFASRQRVPKFFDTGKIAAGRHTDRRRIFHSSEAAHRFFARARRYNIDLQRSVRGIACLRDVFLFWLERSCLCHR